jgi:hypothetical protein
MSGHADSIRRARESWKEGVVEDGVTFEEEWPEEEDEWEDEEWEEEDEWEESMTKKVLNVLLPRLADFVIDVATIAMVPATLLLLSIALFKRATFDLLETGLLVGGATVTTLMIANTKTRLLQRLRLR